MKVFNLQCGTGHRFEGWFGSEGDYESQTARGLLECPVCGATGVQRLPAAPRLNLGHLAAGAQGQRAVHPAPGREPAGMPAAAAAQAGPPASRSTEQAAAQALWLQAVRHVLAHTEDVGERFAEEARRIHYGEADARGIRGRTTREEAQALDEEGIEVYTLPVPAALKGPLQ